jgi:hypothetical protein
MTTRNKRRKESYYYIVKNFPPSYEFYLKKDKIVIVRIPKQTLKRLKEVTKRDKLKNISNAVRLAVLEFLANREKAGE